VTTRPPTLAAPCRRFNYRSREWGAPTKTENYDFRFGPRASHYRCAVEEGDCNESFQREECRDLGRYRLANHVRFRLLLQLKSSNIASGELDLGKAKATLEIREKMNTTLEELIKLGPGSPLRKSKEFVSLANFVNDALGLR